MVRGHKPQIDFGTSTMSIDVNEFMQAVLPHLQKCDATAIADTVNARWSADDVCQLLIHRAVDVRRVAAVTAGLIGDSAVIPCLAGALQDDDHQVNQMAEHSLWSIWFRAGDDRAAAPFREGVAMLAAEKYEQASACFEEATRIDPGFAEAYNQAAIAHFFLGQWQDSIRDCELAMQKMPQHFGAISGMGHSYTQMGQLDKALICYRKALAINPRMPAIARACTRIEGRLRENNDSSGMYLAGGVIS